MAEQHFVCDHGCEGRSEAPGVCEVPNCRGLQKPLRECWCEDGKHNREAHAAPEPAAPGGAA